MGSAFTNGRRVQIIYYLSRGCQLEQPHLLELTISSTEGLYLRDVKKRLMMIRGKEMPSSFSWSYKRSYKNGYVWQDLGDDDLIFPAQGCEYVLKGSRLILSSWFQDEKNQLQSYKGNCEEAEYATNVHTTSKRWMLEKATEISESDGTWEKTVVEVPTSDMKIQGSRLHDEDACNTNAEQVSSNSTHVRDDHFRIGTDEERRIEANSGNSRKLRQFPAYRKPASLAFIENGISAGIQTEQQCKSDAKCSVLIRKGMDAGTQTEREDICDALSLASQDKSSVASEQKCEGLLELDDLRKRKVPLLAWSSSSTPSVCTTAVGSPNCTDKQGITPFRINNKSERANSSYNRAQSQLLEACSSQTTTRKFSKSRSFKLNQVPSSSKVGHSPSSSGIFQFISCGGFDVKGEIIPMSLYFQAKGSQASNTDQVCDLLGSGNCRPWYRLGKRCSSKSKTVLKSSTRAVENTLGCNENDRAVFTSPKKKNARDNFSRAVNNEAVLPDVISVSCSSTSDHSSNSTGELKPECESSKGYVNASREKNARKHDSSQLHGLISPRASKCIFHPIEAGLTEGISPRTPSKDGQDNYGHVVLVKRSSEQCGQDEEHWKMRTERSETMSLLCKELLAPKKEYPKNRDERLLPPARSEADREGTLKNAVELSLPPPNFYQLLQECSNCGRKFRSDSLKMHTRSCNIKKACTKWQQACFQE